MNRRNLCVATGAAMIASAFPARSQDKGQPLTIVVPYAAGGISDIVARLLAKHMSSTLERTIIIENRPGASALIGTKFVQRAKPDGNTILIASQSYMKSPGLLKGFDYEPAADFVCIAKLTTSPYVLMVTQAVPAKTVKEFIDWGRTRSGGVFCASASAGGSVEVMSKAFQRHTGVELKIVQYKGNSDIITALIGGQCEMSITPSTSVFDDAVKAGHLRYLAVTTRDPSLFYPHLQPLRSFVPAMPTDEQWLAFFAPRGTPPQATQQISKAAASALGDTSIQQTLAKNNFQVNYQDTGDFTTFVRTSRVEWEQLVAASGFKKEE
jgi:tripartite-type tricarboxylate transporter receptor subunit TctC